MVDSITENRHLIRISNICECRFYLGQSWWRQIQKLELSEEYKNKTEVGKLLQHVFGLSLINPDLVLNRLINDFMSVIPALFSEHWTTINKNVQLTWVNLQDMSTLKSFHIV